MNTKTTAPVCQDFLANNKQIYRQRAKALMNRMEHLDAQKERLGPEVAYLWLCQIKEDVLELEIEVLKHNLLVRRMERSC